MLERGDKIISNEDLVLFINSLIEKNLLVNKSSADKESFCLVELPSLVNNIDAGINIDAEIKILDDIKNKHELDDRFYNALRKVIKDEVRSEIKNHAYNNLSKDDEDIFYQKSNELWSNDAFINRNNDTLIDALKSEITFLRNKLTSVINLLHKERTNFNDPIQSNPTVYNPIKSYGIKDNYNCNNGYNNSEVNNVNNGNVEYNADHLGNKYDDISHDGFNDVKRKNNNKRSITIIGGSIVKDIKSYKMRKSL